MAKTTVADIAGTLEELKSQLATLAERIEALERAKAGTNGSMGVAAAAPVVAAPIPAPAPAEAAPAEITDEEILAISAAIGAFLGVRAHIRQIRLLSSSAWAQEGRVSIQASHRLN